MEKNPYYIPGVQEIAPERYVELALEIIGLSDDELKSRNRKPKFSAARRALAMKMKKRYKELTLNEIGSFLGVKHDMVIHYNKEVYGHFLLDEYLEKLGKEGL